MSLLVVTNIVNVMAFWFIIGIVTFGYGLGANGTHFDEKSYVYTILSWFLIHLFTTFFIAFIYRRLHPATRLLQIITVSLAPLSVGYIGYSLLGTVAYIVNALKLN